MTRKIPILISLLMLTAITAFSQSLCDVVLVPEGNNLCLTGKGEVDFSVVRACRGNVMSYRARSAGAVGIKGADTLCRGTSYDFSLPLWGSTHYSWSVTPSTGTLYSPGSNILTFIPQACGTYTISVTYTCEFLGCGPYTATRVVEVREPLSVIAPSPRAFRKGSVQTFGTNAAVGGVQRVEVFSLNGRKVLDQEDSDWFDVSGLASGTYIVKVVTKSDGLEYLKLIKH